MNLVNSVDFRSDTVTLPTEEMLEATRHAKLGDDVYREDPTVNQLEEMAAEKMGKEAALLVTSGTQGNLLSLMTNSNPGNLVILESESHIYWYEVGGISKIAGLLPWPVKSEFGAIKPKDIESSIHPNDIHFPKPAMVCIENTHNRHGGTIITPTQMKEISEITYQHNLRFYMDGARIFNAAVALKIDVKKIAKYVDNLMFCLSKGLSCPVGSLLVGSSEFIEIARKNRKVLGGGMRQAGIIAASGIIALEKMIDRLEEDHRNARFLAEELSKINGIQINLNRVQTNILYYDISSLGLSADIFVSKLEEKGILALAINENKVRMVTHRGIQGEHITKTIEIIENIIEKIDSR